MAPILDGVPVILPFPAAILLLAGTPVDWASPAVSAASLPSGGRRWLGLFGGTDGLFWRSWLGTAPAVA